MSLIIWFLAIWTCSACSTSWRVASCFFIRRFSCNINGISEGRARSQSSRLGEAIVRAACLLIEQRVFHLPQRPSHALQDIGVGVERTGIPHGVGRRRRSVAVRAVGVRDAGERRHRQGPGGDGGRCPRRQAQAKAAHDEGGVGFSMGFGRAEKASARGEDSRRQFLVISC
jgi:hypothetical protein